MAMRSPPPPYLVSQLAGRPGARINLVCGACTWSRAYDATRIAERLKAKGLERTCFSINDVARHVPWPCPGCRRMRWYTIPLPFRHDQRIENPTIPLRPPA